jgi:hypothetical protein
MLVLAIVVTVITETQTKKSEFACPEFEERCSMRFFGLFDMVQVV